MFQVDLAFPIFSPIPILKILLILPREIIFFRPRSRIRNLGFSPEEITRPPELPDSHGTSVPRNFRPYPGTSGLNREFTQNSPASPRLFPRPPGLPSTPRNFRPKKKLSPKFQHQPLSPFSSQLFTPNSDLSVLWLVLKLSTCQRTSPWLHHLLTPSNFVHFGIFA